MWKTWLLRGATLAVVAILAGAWAVSLIGNDPAPASTVKHGSTDKPPARHHHVKATAPVEKSHHRHHAANPSDEASDSSDPLYSDVADHPSDAASETSTSPTSPDPTTPGPSGGPSHTPSPHPTPTPTPTPTDPSDDCTDLGGVIDCVLDPITHHP